MIGWLPTQALMTPAAVAALQDAARILDEAIAQAWPVAQGLPPLWEALDRFWAATLPYLPVRCGAGCAACCFDNPRGLTPVEVAGLVLALKALPDAARREAQAREDAAVWAQVLTASPDADTAQRRFKALRRPCPLLGEERRCAVYAARPVACRAFFSLTEPELCDPAHPEAEEAVQPQLEPGPALRERMLRWGRVLGLESGEDLRGGLVEALDAASR